MNIDKIYNVMWWISDSKQSFNIPRLGKYLFKSFDTLKAETKRHYAKDLWKKIDCFSDDVGPSFNGYHEVKHNSVITRQNQLEFWNQKAKQGFS